MKIEFIWNSSFVGTNHSMIIDKQEIMLGGVISNKTEAKQEAIEILKQFNIDYKVEDIEFKWGGRL